MRTVVILVVSLAFISCASTLRDRWEGDPDDRPVAKAPKKSSGTSATLLPPVSFVVPAAGEEVEVTDEAVPPSTAAVAKAPSDAEPEQAAEPADAAPVERRPHEIKVTVESTAPELLKRQGATDRLRSDSGEPLSGADQYGDVRTPPSEVASASIPAPKPPKKKGRKSKEAVPPVVEPAKAAEAEAEPAPVVAPPPAPVTTPSRKRRPVTTSEEGSPAAEAPAEAAPEPAVAALEHKAALTAEEQSLQEAAPAPAEPAPSRSSETKPAQAAHDSAFINVPVAKPEKRKKKKAPPGLVADGSDGTTTPYDPFRKLDQEMAAIDGPKPEPTEPPSPPRARHSRSAPSVVAPRLSNGTTGTDESHPSDTVERPANRPIRRDPSLLGLSFTGGVGVLLASGARPGFMPALAYGGQITWSPSFLGDFALDLGYWRASSNTGTDFESVTTTDNDMTGRILWLKPVGSGFYTGFGLGILMTLTTSDYHVSGQPPGNAGVLRAGGDATITVGYRISYFETRLDLRTLLRGGLRIEFLPTLSVGVTF